MKKANAIIILLTGSLLCSIAFAAANLPNYYPANFRNWGVLERLDIEGGVAVINDIQMILSDNIQVHTLNSRFASLHALHSGLKVGVALTARDNGRPLVTDIWVLPDDYSYTPH